MVGYMGLELWGEPGWKKVFGSNRPLEGLMV